MKQIKHTILICGTRKTDLLEAEQLIASVRKFYQQSIEIILYTNFIDYQNTDIDQIFIIEKPYFGFADKVYAMVHVPREQVLYLDTDTLLLNKIDDLYNLLERFDIAAAHAPNRWTYKLENIPDAFPEFNCGVILFKRSEKVNTFLHSWFQKYLQQLEQGINMPSGDQPSFREFLYLSDLRVSTLTPEYNCRFNMGSLASHSVKILHGRISDFKYVEERINKGPKLPWTDEPGIRFIRYEDPLP